MADCAPLLSSSFPPSPIALSPLFPFSSQSRQPALPLSLISPPAPDKAEVRGRCVVDKHEEPLLPSILNEVMKRSFFSGRSGPSQSRRRAVVPSHRALMHTSLDE